MADDKIVHRISLEGADKVAKQLEAIGLEGDKSTKKIQSALDGTRSSFARFGEGFEEKAEGNRRSAERFREVLHTIHQSPRTRSPAS
jgi:hypothetical protein